MVVLEPMSPGAKSLVGLLDARMLSEREESRVDYS
jgi:hypothetical protein